MSDKMQFDITLGGDQGLPNTVQIAKLIEGRSQEIKIMRSNLATQTTTKLAFQMLPKHMRRRTMSHNVKRLPIRIRKIHTSQMQKSGQPIQTKRPSRKYRRRPRNLCEAYTKRSARIKWLQTHIWHAKRFHMVERWGFKIPHRPCDKAFRACYRAVAKHCLVQDISYVRCIEIGGARNIIIDGFKTITETCPGVLSIGAKAYSKGHREGQITLYKKTDDYLQPIGEINFHWRPNTDENQSILWLWAHAAYHEVVLQTLVDTFNLSTQSPGVYSADNILVRDLGQELSRFRLYGPLSNSTLQAIFILLDTINDSSPKWIDNHILETARIQADLWKSMKTLGDLSTISPHIIMSLIVKDPRFDIPKKRSTCSVECDENIVQDFPIFDSPLWDTTIRNDVNENKLSDAEFSKRRSNLLVSGEDISGSVSYIPVILIQRPGCGSKDNLGFGSGWDLIVPSSWAKPFWISIIMRCARAGGLRELDSTVFEMGKPYYLYPDTESGKAEEERLTKELKEKFFKKPPNKRINFNKFNIVSPFTCNWELLIKDWSALYNPQVDRFNVIRDQILLSELQDFLYNKRKILPNLINDHSLVPVRIIAHKKGLIQPFAILCLPNGRDSVRNDPLESLNKDTNQEERKKVRNSHQTLLKRLRRRRILERRKTKKFIKLPEDHKEILESYTKKMRELWLPEPTTIRNTCSREIIGFVRSGGFSFVKGQSVGIGYITSGSLKNFVGLSNRRTILCRNTNSRQYRWTTLSILTN